MHSGSTYRPMGVGTDPLAGGEGSLRSTVGQRPTAT
jgi:hypothetical protein